MTDLFISVLNMSITASYVILAVLLLRLTLKGFPKKYSYALWSVVGFRLICPFSFKSVFSLFSLNLFDMTKAQRWEEHQLNYIPPTDKTAFSSEVTTGIPSLNSVAQSTVISNPAYQKNYSWLLLALMLLWCAGILTVLIISAVKLLKLKQQLRFAVKAEGNIYTCENISSPFIVGIIKPKIYIPAGIDESYKEYVLAHERYHLKRRDNIIKLFAYFLLVLHWFNPLVWLAFYLMSKDMEMSCDEAVLNQNEGIKKAYSTALLYFATDKKFPAPSPLSFSENGVRARIKNVLKYKKPKKVLQAAAIMLCLALLTACAANPKQTVTEESVKNAFDKISSSFESDNYTAGKVIGANMAISMVRENGYYYDKITVKKDSLKIVDNLGNQIFVSEKAEKAPLAAKDDNGVLELETGGSIPLTVYEDYRYLFRDGDYTCITYTNSKMTEEGTVTYKVYYNNGAPFAFCDMNWVYLLEPEDMDSLITDAILKNEKDNYIKGDYFGEAHRILDTKFVDRTEQEVVVYLYAKVAWLSQEKGNELGNRLVNTSGSAGPVIITFSKDGSRYTLNDYEGLGSLHESDLRSRISESDYQKLEQLQKTGTKEIDQALYKQVAEKYSLDTTEFIMTAFDLWDGYVKTEEDRNTLINFGEYTVKYCFSHFINEDGEESLERKYMLILKELLGYDAQSIEARSGRDFFDMLVTEYRNDRNHYKSDEEMQKNSPYGYLLLQMTGNLFETSDYVKQVYQNNPVFNKGEKITFAKAKELIINGDSTKITDFQDYEYADSASGVYDYTLDIADFNGYLCVGTGAYDLTIELFANDGTLLENYSRPVTADSLVYITEKLATELAEKEMQQEYGSGYSDFVFNGEIELQRANEGDFVTTLNPGKNDACYAVHFNNFKKSVVAVCYIDARDGTALDIKEYKTDF